MARRKKQQPKRIRRRNTCGVKEKNEKYDSKKLSAAVSKWERDRGEVEPNALCFGNNKFRGLSKSRRRKLEELRKLEEKLEQEEININNEGVS